MQTQRKNQKRGNHNKIEEKRMKRLTFKFSLLVSSSPSRCLKTQLHSKPEVVEEMEEETGKMGLWGWFFDWKRKPEKWKWSPIGIADGRLLISCVMCEEK